MRFASTLVVLPNLIGLLSICVCTGQLLMISSTFVWQELQAVWQVMLRAPDS